LHHALHLHRLFVEEETRPEVDQELLGRQIGVKCEGALSLVLGFDEDMAMAKPVSLRADQAHGAIVGHMHNRVGECVDLRRVGQGKRAQRRYLKRGLLKLRSKLAHRSAQRSIGLDGIGLSLHIHHRRLLVLQSVEDVLKHFLHTHSPLSAAQCG
jgi:hypothetical protein